MRLHHIAFRTGDVARLAHFYGAVLGLAERQAPRPEVVWFDAAGVIVMIEPATPTEPGPSAGTMDLIAFTITASDVTRFRNTLALYNVPIEHETAYTIYVRDPDGRRIGLSHFEVA